MQAFPIMSSPSRKSKSATAESGGKARNVIEKVME